MRILWITNMLLPDIAYHINKNVGARRGGTWLDNWLNEIRNSSDIELAVASISGKNFLDETINGVRYFVIPGNGKTMLLYNKNLQKYWEKIEQSFSPDIIHIHGTEYTHSVSYLRKYPNKKYVLSVQGLIGPIEREYYGGLSFFTALKFRTLKEWISGAGIVGKKALYKTNVKYEQEIIKKSDVCIGRYDFDKYYVKSINDNITYERCFYSLREEFYSSKKWCIEDAEPYTIYAGAAVTSPLKGGHVLLNALEIVKRKYSNVKVIFVGVGNAKGALVESDGYRKYIAKLIRKKNLQDNVEFFPALQAQEIIDTMLKSRCAVIPSAMDNGSTMLREAMHLGVPSVVAFRGGLTGLVKEGESGLFFDYAEESFLAGRILQMLEDNELCSKLSAGAVENSAIWHDKKNNASKLIEIYNNIAIRGENC